MLNLLIFFHGSFGVCGTWHDESTLLLQSTLKSVLDSEGSRTVEAYYESLWNGMETENEDFVSLEMNASLTGRKGFKVLGLYNTGTNLLTSLLKLNFELPMMANALSEKPQGLEECSFWKHSSLRVLKEVTPAVLDYCDKNGVVGLAMIRNPLSWLKSFKGAAYDLKACHESEHWYNQPCTFPKTTSADSFLAMKTYKNVETIWKMWNTDYQSLSSYGFSKNLLIRYEDLVEDTEGTLGKIAVIAGLDVPESIIQEERNMSPMRPKHPSTGRIDALEGINSKSYLDAFTQLDLVEVCKQLDIDLMRRHGYTDCDAVLQA